MIFQAIVSVRNAQYTTECHAYSVRYSSDNQGYDNAVSLALCPIVKVGQNAYHDISLDLQDAARMGDLVTVGISSTIDSSWSQFEIGLTDVMVDNRPSNNGWLAILRVEGIILKGCTTTPY